MIKNEILLHPKTTITSISWIISIANRSLSDAIRQNVVRVHSNEEMKIFSYLKGRKKILVFENRDNKILNFVDVKDLTEPLNRNVQIIGRNFAKDFADYFFSSSPSFFTLVTLSFWNITLLSQAANQLLSQERAYSACKVWAIAFPILFVAVKWRREKVHFVRFLMSWESFWLSSTYLTMYVFQI